MNVAPLCLSKKAGLYRDVYDFSVDYDSIDVGNVLDI